MFFFFFFQAEDGIRDLTVTGVQTCALPILPTRWVRAFTLAERSFATNKNNSISSLRHMSKTNHPTVNEAPPVVFGYKCQECGRGTVRSTNFAEYSTKIQGYPLLIRNATIGICDSCGAKHRSEERRVGKECRSRWSPY